VTVVPVRDAEGLGWYVGKIEVELTWGDFEAGLRGVPEPVWYHAHFVAVLGPPRRYRGLLIEPFAMVKN
jgi:hypothetical protein